MSRPNDQPTAAADTAAAKPQAPRHFLSSLAGATLWTAVWAGVAAILLGAGFIPWLASDSARLSRLIAQAVPGLQADVTIGTAQIGWSGPIVIEDLRVVPRNGSRPPVSIKRIEGNHGLAAMLVSLATLAAFGSRGSRPTSFSTPIATQT